MKNKLILKELSLAELQEKLDAERTSYQKMLLNHAVSPIENTNNIRVSRRNIARYLTEIRQRELGKQELSK